MSKLLKTRHDKHEEMKALLSRLENNYSDADAAQLRALDAEYTKLTELVEIEVRANAAGKTMDEVMDKRVITTGGKSTDAEMRAAFINYVRTGDMTEVRNINSFASSEGGVNVPTVLVSQIQKALAEASVMRTIGARILNTTSTTTLPLANTALTALWKDQSPSASYAETAQAFGNASLGAHKLTALVKISEELLQDASTDLEATIAANTGVAFGNAEETAFVSGSGTLQPLGLLRITTAGGNSTLAQTIGSLSGSFLDNIIDGYYKMSANKRKQAVFIVGSGMASAMRKAKTTTGEYLWDTSVVAGQPDTFNGRPVFETNAAPATWQVGGVVGALLFPQHYVIGDRGGYSLQRLMELYAAEGNVGYKSFKRVDAVLTDGNSLVRFTAGAA